MKCYKRYRKIEQTEDKNTVKDQLKMKNDTSLTKTDKRQHRQRQSDMYIL